MTGGSGYYGWPDGSDGYAHGAGVSCDLGTITNSIIWDNNGEEEIYAGGTDVSYSNIKGGYAGTNNIDADPCFVTGPLGDYYLRQVAAGQASDSPCVNTGSDTVANLGMDIYTTRTDNVWDKGFVDMGYHYSGNLADLNNDGDVDFFDFSILASQWQEAPSLPSADIAPDGGDGVVDEKDLGILCDNWLWEE